MAAAAWLDREDQPRSLAALKAMSWQDFEAFALEVVRRLYEPEGIVICPTRAGPDGGRDGEGVLQLARRSQSPLSLTLWVEIKRHSRAVGRQQVGGHIFAAIGASANVVVIVSCSGFSRSFPDEMNRLSGRTGVRYQLIDGEQLLELAFELREDGSERPAAKGADPQPAAPEEPVHVRRTSFAATPLPRDRAPMALPLPLVAPAFLTVEYELRLGSACTDVEIGLTHAHGHASFEPLTGTRIRRVTLGERLSTVFLVTPRTPGRICASDLTLHLRASSCSPGKSAERSWSRALPPSCAEAAVIFAAPLVPFVPTSAQAGALAQIESIYRGWRGNRGCASLSIEAAAGVGKSSLLTATRWLWLKEGVREIVLDGESENSVWAVLFSVFAHILPVDTNLVASFNHADFSAWLEGAGADRALAARLARSICSGGNPKGEFSPTELENILVVLLRHLGGSRPLVLVFEDLHKAGGSVLRLLYGTRRVLAAPGNRDILFCFTSRFQSQTHPAAGAHEAWGLERERLLGDESNRRFQLDLPTIADAERILAAAIPNLYPELAAAVVERAGRTPFGLAEVVRYLEERRVLTADAAGGGLSLQAPAEFLQVLKDPVLVRSTATDQRLALLTDRLPEWGHRLIELAACIGREFDLELLLRHARCEPLAPAELEALLADLVRDGVLTSPAGMSRFDCRFEHDLIREAVLRRLAEPTNRLRHRRLAAELLDDAGLGGEAIRLSLLYQSGAGERFVEEARAYGNALARSGYPYEAAGYFMLENEVLDPRNSPPDSDDPAFRTAPVPSLPQSPSAAELLDVKRRLFEALEKVSGGSGEALQRLISDFRMLAARTRNHACAALAERWEGHFHVLTGSNRKAVDCFARAEAIYARAPAAAPADLFEAVIGKAIALRLLGQRDLSAAELDRAPALDPGNPKSRIRYHANLGALYFYDDAAKRRDHWESALRIAREAAIKDLCVHMDLDVLSLDILDGRFADARDKVERLIETASQRRFENSLTRALIMGSGLDLIEGWPDAALARLDEARRLGYAHDSRRRLWKIHANSASAYEMMGDLERARHEDGQMLRVLTEVAGERRVALAPANLLLRIRRYAQDAAYRRLADEMPVDTRTAAEAVLKALDSTAGIAKPFPREHLQCLAGQDRFVAI